MAVEDRASDAPIASAASGGWPTSIAVPAVAHMQSATCSAPMPNT